MHKLQNQDRCTKSAPADAAFMSKSALPGSPGAHQVALSINCYQGKDQISVWKQTLAKLDEKETTHFIKAKFHTAREVEHYQHDKSFDSKRCFTYFSAIFEQQTHWAI